MGRGLGHAGLRDREGVAAGDQHLGEALWCRMEAWEKRAVEEKG